MRLIVLAILSLAASVAAMFLAVPAARADGGQPSIGGLVGRTAALAGQTAATLVETTQPTTTDVSEATAPLVGPVGEAGRPVVAPLAEVTGPVLDTLEEEAAPVLEATSPAIDPILETAEPVLEPVRPALEPVTEALSPVTDALRPTIGLLPPPLDGPPVPPPPPMGGAEDADDLHLASPPSEVPRASGEAHPPGSGGKVASPGWWAPGGHGLGPGAPDHGRPPASPPVLPSLGSLLRSVLGAAGGGQGQTGPTTAAALVPLLLLVTVLVLLGRIPQGRVSLSLVSAAPDEPPR